MIVIIIKLNRTIKPYFKKFPAGNFGETFSFLERRFMNSNIFKKVMRFGEKESPNLLTTLGVAGVLSTTILAIKATPKALEVIQDEQMSSVKDLMTVDKIKLTWRYYLPTVISGLITTACIISVNNIHVRRHAALGALYSITEGALKEYQQKVIEVVGKKKESDIRDEIAQDKLNTHPLTEDLLLTGIGQHLFYDSLSARYFRSDIESVRRSINTFNADLLQDMYKVLNEFYDEIGIEGTDMGKNMGWDIENGLLDVRFSSKIASSGEPCVVLEYPVSPRFL